MNQDQYADLVLTNARVLTLDRTNPTAWFVAIKDGLVLGVGTAEEVRQFTSSRTRRTDCQGYTLLPGFNDAHCHLLALASSLRGVDCRANQAPSIAHIANAIRLRAENTPPGEWVRAFGYDEFYVAEKRHPTRWEIDRAAPDHPVRLDHRTGHASVLNSFALGLLDITRCNAGPIDGVVEREDDTGEPTGLTMEMGEYISQAHGPPRDDCFIDGIRHANATLLSKGITSIQDASPVNDYHRWRTAWRLKESGHLTPRLNMMAGANKLPSFLEMGVAPGYGDENIRLGAMKLMVTTTAGYISPSVEELNDTVYQAHVKGFQLAVHSVEEEVLGAVLEAFDSAQTQFPRPAPRHRIEHCSECPPRLAQKLAHAPVVVVTQPGFIHMYGEKYLSTVDQSLLPHLYTIGSLTRAGVHVAAGSDAPVMYPDPLSSIYGAVTRRTGGGSLVGEDQRISVEKALKMHTIEGAYAAFEEKEKGSISMGKLADLVLLDEDPTSVDPEALKDINVMMTLVGGNVVWEA